MPELLQELLACTRLQQAALAAERAGAISTSLTSLADDTIDSPISADGATSCDADALPIRLQINGYQLGKEINHGGQATVFRGIQESTGQRVAIKVLTGGPYVGSRGRARFDREVQVLATIKDPHVVHILDRGRTADGSFFLVMELVEGTRLDDYARRLVETKPANLDALVTLFIKFAQALHRVHAQGIVHRDLKPPNVLVDASGEPRILDFGRARLLHDEPSPDPAQARTITRPGQVVGSLPWASPEQATDSASVDARSDIYSIGVMLYVAIGDGSFPYDVSGPIHKVIGNVLNAQPRPLKRSPARAHALTVRFLHAVVWKALSKSPGDRYATAAELARDLSAILQGAAPAARRVRPRWRRWAVSIVSLVITAGIVTAYLSTRTSNVVQFTLPKYHNSLGMTLVRLPAGRLSMGSSTMSVGHQQNERLHEVEVAHPVYLSVTEVEWEYACRTGSTGSFAGTQRLDSMGWYKGNSEHAPHLVARKSPTEWGLYDMHGNVAEWCSDDYNPGYIVDFGSIPNPEVRTIVVKGGSFDSDEGGCRSANRRGIRPDDHAPSLGFRVAMDP